MNTSTLEILEFHRVLNNIAERAFSPPGADLVTALYPSSDYEIVLQQLQKVSEMDGVLEAGEAPPFRGFYDLRDQLKTVMVEGSMLSPDSLLKFASTLGCSRLVRKFFESRASKASRLAFLCRDISFFEDFEGAVHHAIDESCEVRDSATPELKAIRSQVTVERQRVRQTLARLLKEWGESGILQESIIASRDGRLTLPVKDTMKGRVSGILVDQSATGSTAFIEPLETVEINNHLKRLELEEKREVERILKQITSMLFRRKAEVVDTLKIMAEIDCIFARAQYARDYNCCMPVISTENKIKIIQGRHPLLLMKQMNVVPLDLELGGEHVTMVISGPNAGGKTVALKTVGLLTLMAAAGCFVPAEKGTELPLVEEMHAVIGDEQSISADLSTFTGHVTKLTKVVKNSETRKLALIDEILSGTDPNEGTALAIAIMEKLTADRALTLVTTHKGDLKAYAHNAEGVINGSMEFDGETLSPTYRFRPGIPGSSYAFAISKKVGLSEELIERARQIQGEKKHELDSLIVELQTKLNEANKIAVKSEAERIKWETQRNLYTEKLKGIKSIEEKLKEKAMAEAERIMADANRTLELAVKAVREGEASKDAIKSAHEIIETGRERMSKRRRKKTISKEAVTEPIAVGDRVRIEESGVTGEILLVKDKERKFLILAGGLKIWMNREDLIKLKPQKEVKSQDIKIKHSISVATISPEIDIRGLDGAEAASKLEEYLAKISFENFDRVDIIHGKGKGVLKKVTTDILQENPSVKSFRHGRWGEGDDGVTIVELKKEK